MIKIPYPWEPFMSLKTIEPHVATIFKVDHLKEIIKKLEKENSNLRFSLGKVTSEKYALKLNLSQKRGRFIKANIDIQIEQYKRRKVGEVLKGTCENLEAKKKQLAEAQYQTCKMEINYEDQIKNL